MNDEKIRQSIRAAIDDCTGGIDEAPSLRYRIAREAKGEKTVKKKIYARVICVIAVLMLGTMTALAAGVEDINAILYELWPEAARALRPLNLGDEQAGIRLDVLSAELSDDHYLVTYSLTDLEGDRIDEKVLCYAELDIDTENCTGRNELLSYDPEKRQAVYGSYFEYSLFPDNPLPKGSDPIRLSVEGIQRIESVITDLWPLMEGRDYRAEAVQLSAGCSSVQKLVYGEGWVQAEGAAPRILNPENNLHIPLMGNIELCGIGWIDGNLHVQTHISDNEVKAERKPYDWYYYRYSCQVFLCDLEGRNMAVDEDFQRQRGNHTWVRWEEGGDVWEERIFPIREDEKENYRLEAENENMRSGVEDLLQYEWQVTFPANMIRKEEQ